MNQKRRNPKTKKDNPVDYSGTNYLNQPICSPFISSGFVSQPIPPMPISAQPMIQPTFQYQPQIQTPQVGLFPPQMIEKDFTKRTEKIAVLNYCYENPRIEFDCDIMLVELIKLLNILSFNTEYCCSGHMEDAFLSFYIRFDSIGNDVLDDFISFVRMTDDLYLEKEIEFVPENTGSGCHYVQLTDPIDDDIDAAIKLVFKGKTIDDFDELLKQGLINKYYTIRHKITKEFEAGTFVDVRDYAEKFRDRNYERVKRAISNFTDKLYIYLSYKLNPKQVEEANRRLS